METKKEKEKNFEENLEALEEIVKKLENGDIPLDEAINKFNEGMVLAGKCNEILEKATETITNVMNKDGSLEKFDIKVSRLSYGIPMGSDMEYLDPIMISKAWDDRKTIS